MNRADFIQQRRKDAWSRGREIRDGLLNEYRQRYNVSTVPAPALIVYELLRDFLDAKIQYTALGDNVFAETEWDGVAFVVRVNSETASIQGVKDAQGVQAVGIWHEVIHIEDDAHQLKEAPQALLPGFDMQRKIACHRSLRRGASEDERAREFWAEEAGRAAAVSMDALGRSVAFAELRRLGSRGEGRVREGFPLLYQAAEDIGVNISALVKQLTLEGRIAIVEEGGRRLVQVQRELSQAV